MSGKQPSKPGRSRCVEGLNDYEYQFSFHIAGGDHSPEQLTELLGIEPTSFHRQGEPRTTYGGKLREGVWPGHFWACEAPVIAGASVSESVAAFLLAMRPFSANFAALVATGAELSLFVGFFANQLCDDEFPPSTLKALGELGIALRLDYHNDGAIRTLIDEAKPK